MAFKTSGKSFFADNLALSPEGWAIPYIRRPFATRKTKQAVDCLYLNHSKPPVMKSLLLLWLSLSLFAPFAHAQNKLAIVGSSTAACFGPSSFDSCYAGRLSAFYNKALPWDTIVDNEFAKGGNTCFSGMPSSYVSPYSDPALQPDPAHNITAAIASKPSVILVNFPSNAYDTLPISKIMFCLRTIRDSSLKAGIPCFVTTTQPRTTGNYASSEVKRKMAAIKDSILQQFGFFAIDFYKDLINADSSIRYDAGDGIHMNDKGHDSLFHRVVAKQIFATVAGSALPATFVNLSAKTSGGSNIISWTTSAAINIDHYEVDRSADARNFSPVGSISPIENETTHTYQFVDAQPLAGSNYYKIVIVDRDRKTYASPALTVAGNNSHTAILKTFSSGSAIYTTVQSAITQNMQIQIISSMGSSIWKGSRRVDAGTSTLSLPVTIAATGVYHLQMTNGTAVYSQSFIRN